ncbi:chitin synthase III catalytic subunit [Mortierella sp. GBAus27b]|nr:chitin synthase III catalytic subunit [Mortierella sp. GBAus27b]
MSTWFGDFNTICFSACVPLPSCNLLRSNNQNVSLSGLVSGAEADQCLSGPTSNVRDYSTAVIVVLGIVFIVYRRLRRPFGMSSAVGRAEMNMLLFTYSCILLLQFFTIGGIARNNGTFMVWASALHLGATACFFWTLIINAVILFQFVEDNTKTIQASRTMWQIRQTNAGLCARANMKTPLPSQLGRRGGQHGSSS